MYTVLLALGVIYFLSHALALTFKRTRVPDVLVLMLIGVAVGPMLGLVNPAQFGDIGGVITTIALTVILFESGTTIDARAVIRAAGGTAKLTFSTLLATLLIAGALAWVGAGDLTLYEATILGAIICGTSSAVVIPMVRSLKLKEESSTLLVLESAVTDVVCIVLVFALLEGASRGGVALGPLVGQVMASLMFATAIGFAGGVFWLRIWNFVRRIDTTIFTTIAAAFILYGVAEFLRFSGPIAALAFGVTLSNYEYFRVDRIVRGVKDAGVTDVERGFYREIVFILKTIFFLYLGVSMRFDEPLVFLTAAAIVVAIYAARVALARKVLPARTPRRDAAIAGVMVPKGLAAAVLAGLPLAAGMPGGEHIQNLTFAMVLASITLTALLVIGLERGKLDVYSNALFGKFPAAAPEPVADAPPLLPPSGGASADSPAALPPEQPHDGTRER